MNGSLLVKSTIVLVGVQCAVTLVLMGLVLDSERPADQPSAVRVAELGAGAGAGGPGGPGGPGGGGPGGPGGQPGGPGGGPGGHGPPGGHVSYDSESAALAGYLDLLSRQCDLSALEVSGRSVEEAVALREAALACPAFDCPGVVDFVSVLAADGKPLPTAPSWTGAPQDKLTVFDQVSSVGAELHRALSKAEKLDHRPDPALAAATLACASTDCEAYEAWATAVSAAAEAADVPLPSFGGKRSGGL